MGRRHSNETGWIFRDVDLRLAAGDRVGLRGRSGAGKTVILRSLALLDPLDSGQVRWQGERVYGETVPEYRSQVIYLHQTPALGRETVDGILRQPFSLATQGEREFDRERALELLVRLGRERSFLAKARTDLSGGEVQLTALVRGLLLEPRVLLLDEPTAALDPETTLRVEALLRKWVQESEKERAYLWVCHDGEQRRRVADRSLTIASGKLD